MKLDELEATLKKLAEHSNSKECHELQTKNFELYLILSAIGNLAEVALRLIKAWTRHDQW
jgi:hypothetical protein